MCVVSVRGCVCSVLNVCSLSSLLLMRVLPRGL